jgi:hypothetical protein
MEKNNNKEIEERLLSKIRKQNIQDLKKIQDEKESQKGKISIFVYIFLVLHFGWVVESYHRGNYGAFLIHTFGFFGLYRKDIKLKIQIPVSLLCFFASYLLT